MIGSLLLKCATHLLVAHWSGGRSLAQSTWHSLTRSFGVISSAPVTGPEEELAIGLNDGGGHNLESYRHRGCDGLAQAGVGAWFCICMEE